MKKIAVLGLSGSIGMSTLDVIRRHNSQFQITLAQVHNNYQQLFSLAIEFNIPCVVITNEKLKDSITDIPVGLRVLFGKATLLAELANDNYDILLNGIAGSAGLEYTIEGIKHHKDIALANKESLVMAGHIINNMLATSTSRLLPVDSEHSAIFQAIGASRNDVRNIHITASGGPFKNLPLADFESITIADTLAHPTWKMGQKITVDSATMMNKGLEVIEAHHLFKIDYPSIKAVIHPQSIVHSLVEFLDGSIIAQLSSPTMKLPILYALSYPQHIDSDIVSTDITALSHLSFNSIEKARYPLFFTAIATGKAGGILPTVLNAANEAAVSLFLAKKIRFVEIAKLVEKIVEEFNNYQNPSLADILAVNSSVFEKTKRDYKKYV